MKTAKEYFEETYDKGMLARIIEMKDEEIILLAIESYGIHCASAAIDEMTNEIKQLKSINTWT